MVCKQGFAFCVLLIEQVSISTLQTKCLQMQKFQKKIKFAVALLWNWVFSSENTNGKNLKKNLKFGRSLEFIFAKWLELKWKKKLKLFQSSTSQGWTIQLFKVKLDWCERKTDKTPYLIEIDSVKWTGKVPVRTAITDTCEGQVSAALLQWQVLRFLRYKVMKWNIF
jgi:hypothetical protein